MLISIVYIYTYPLLVRAKRGEKIIAPQGPMHRQSLCRYNPISTNPRSLCSENPRRVAPTQILPKKIPRTQPSSGRDHPPNAQAAGELCVDKTQSAQICNLCVEKNPRPRRARTNSRARTFLIGKSTNGRFSNKKNARPNSCAEQNRTGRVTKLTPADFCAERDPARPRLPQHYPAGDS